LFQILTWFFTTFTASNIKDKVKMVYGIEYLYSQVNPDQLDVPPFALDYDLKVKFKMVSTFSGCNKSIVATNGGKQF
jgi:hypothetical protein